MFRCLSRITVLSLLPGLLIGSSVYGWSTREHVQFAHVAAIRLQARGDTPAAMRAWLKEVTPEAISMEAEHASLNRPTTTASKDLLDYWTVYPDLAAADRKEIVEPYGVPERALHFTDLEHFHPDREHHRYHDDLSSLPELKDIPRDLKDARYRSAGFLPFRAEECYQRSVESLRQGQATGETMKWMGMLSHYLADSTQPHHGTEDYKSRSYLEPTLRKVADAHADLEFRLLEGRGAVYDALREEYWKRYVAALDEFRPEVSENDPWEATVETLRKSYTCLPLIGRAAAAAYSLSPEGKPKFDPERFFHFRHVVDGREMTVLEMKARQAAWATMRIERLWQQAWTSAESSRTPTTNGQTLR